MDFQKQTQNCYGKHNEKCYQASSHEKN